MFHMSGLSSVKSGLNIEISDIAVLMLTNLETWSKCKALHLTSSNPSMPGANLYRKSPRVLFPSLRSWEE